MEGAPYIKPDIKEKYVFIETFGCQMNENDTERTLSFLRGPGYFKTDCAEKAGLILVNTCGVREKAEQKVYSALGRFKELKNENPHLIIGVMGCVAQKEGSRLLKKIPHLDMVIGTHNIHNIAFLIKEVAENKKRVAKTEFYATLDAREYSARPEGGVKAFVSIMRGCDNFCAYCIVPHVRGKEVSRRPHDILKEARELAEKGTKEVCLIGQNVNSYKGDATFPALLKMVCEIDGIERVRFVTSHPKDISEELICLFGEEQKIAKSIHLPLQSGSDRILGLMRRGYTVSGYLEKVNILRNLYPDISITTDIIAGFPGETDEDFEKTMDCIVEAEFDGIFSFKYSPRPMTDAASFKDQVPFELKQARLERLQSAQKEITAKKNISLVGKTMEVLVEGKSKLSPEELTGRTGCNRAVNFAGAGEEGLYGRIIDVLITGAGANSLKGTHQKERGLLCC